MVTLHRFIIVSLIMSFWACNGTLPPITIPPITINLPPPVSPAPPPVVVPPPTPTGAIYVTVSPSTIGVIPQIVGTGSYPCTLVHDTVYLCNPIPVGTYWVEFTGAVDPAYELVSPSQVTVVANQNQDAFITFILPTPPTPPVIVPPAPPTSSVLFDHPWTGRVESTFHDLLASGLAGVDGLQGQTVVDRLNAMGGIYAGAEFQPSHNGNGFPTYGFPWFYVSYINNQGPPFYQIVEFGTPPVGN